MEIRWSTYPPLFLASVLLLTSALLLLSLAASVAHGQSPQPPAAPGEARPYDESEAQAIDGMLMCPVCPAETIDQAQVPLARQMRQIVREMLAQGATRQEILDFFAQRYGTDVLAAPPKSGFNLVAWVFPPVGVAATLAAGFLVLRSMSARRSRSPVGVPVTQQAGEDLAPYLEMVDRQLSLDQGAGGRPAPQRSLDRDGATGGASGRDPGDVGTGREDGRHDG